jgi:hypothetical protein
MKTKNNKGQSLGEFLFFFVSGASIIILASVSTAYMVRAEMQENLIKEGYAHQVIVDPLTGDTEFQMSTLEEIAEKQKTK